VTEVPPVAPVVWALVTAVATVYRIVSGRTRAAFTDLAGPDDGRVATSNRHALYIHPPDTGINSGGRRQNAESDTARDLVGLTNEFFGLWEVDQRRDAHQGPVRRQDARRVRLLHPAPGCRGTWTALRLREDGRT
jgi:hypothetical protein